MNYIETTTKHDGLEDAEDALAGLRMLEGFKFGYVRLPAADAQKHEVVTVFEVRDDGTPSTGQRQVLID